MLYKWAPGQRIDDRAEEYLEQFNEVGIAPS